MLNRKYFKYKNRLILSKITDKTFLQKNKNNIIAKKAEKESFSFSAFNNTHIND